MISEYKGNPIPASELKNENLSNHCLFIASFQGLFVQWLSLCPTSGSSSSANFNGCDYGDYQQHFDNQAATIAKAAQDAKYAHDAQVAIYKAVQVAQAAQAVKDQVAVALATSQLKGRLDALLKTQGYH